MTCLICNKLTTNYHKAGSGGVCNACYEGTDSPTLRRGLERGLWSEMADHLNAVIN